MATLAVSLLASAFAAIVKSQPGPTSPGLPPTIAFLHAAPSAPDASGNASVPLCPGLTIVTAVNQADGDYESIKTIESVSDERVRIKYSAEAPNADMLSTDPSPIKKVVVYRDVRTKDLQTAKMYQQIFLQKSDELIPETTAIGVSAAVLNSLKTRGEAEFAISSAHVEADLTADRAKRPNAYDYLQMMRITRVGTGSMKLPVLVNDTRVELAAIQVQGELAGDRSEFYILDDDKNPLMLKFRLGIAAVKPLGADALAFCETMKKAGGAQQAAQFGCNRPAGGDRDTLRVVKISYRCAPPPDRPAAGAGGQGGQAPAGGASFGSSQLEKALADTRHADVYSIYFTFNSDAIREESEPALKEIAEVMRKHPDWTLIVNGHTDNIASDSYNLKLSERRAAAVKEALVKRYRIAPPRLLTGGIGKSQPKDTNDTVEGRARNRRVELVRQ